MNTILVSGGCGFIGSEFIRFMLRNSDHGIVNLDALTYAGNPQNLSGVRDHSRYTFIKGDIRDRERVFQLFSDREFDAVVNFAAESHVDRSIHNAGPFVTTNVLGTSVLLDATLEYEVPRFVQVSTDEVYGSLSDKGKFTESDPLQPNSPYAATKASADHLVQAYVETYDLPAVITRSCNNYGPYQYPEKLIPLMTLNALTNKPLPVYGDGTNVRDWIYVEDHARALSLVLAHGEPGEVYNIGANQERTNLQVVKEILRQLDKPHDLIQFVEDRPGHDYRYALDARKIRRELDWEPQYDFNRGLRETIRWYIDNRDWVQNTQSSEYEEYYERQYGERLKHE